MVKKSVKKKSTKKVLIKKTHIKSKTRAYPKNKIKETVRVKTFIVEKPVYIETPSRFQRIRERLPRYSSEESRYSRKSEKDYEDDLEEKYARNESPENLTEDERIDDSMDENFDESEQGAVDDYSEDGGGEPQTQKGHLRSRGMFNNVWWKKGLLKGFFVWVIVLIIFYIFDFLGMAEVIDAKRWFFFLVLLLILGMGYQKYISGKVDF